MDSRWHSAAGGSDARYATVLSGTRFRLTDPQPTLERWRQTQAALRPEPGKDLGI